MSMPDHKSPYPWSHKICNFDAPFLGNHYHTLNVSDLSLGHHLHLFNLSDSCPREGRKLSLLILSITIFLT